jgi:hypothetical protein
VCFGSAHAWEAGVEGGFVRSTIRAQMRIVRLTYDPSLPEYTIAIRLADAPWPESEPLRDPVRRTAQGNMISTGRHVLSEDGRTLSVSDRGFGNVLNGLEFNVRRTGGAGDRVVTIDLDGAAPEVAAFRACTASPSV